MRHSNYTWDEPFSDLPKVSNLEWQNRTNLRLLGFKTKHVMCSKSCKFSPQSFKDKRKLMSLKESASKGMINFLITRSSIKAGLQLCCTGSLLCSLTLTLHFITNSAAAIPGISVMLTKCETYSKQGKWKKEFLICIYYKQRIESGDVILMAEQQWRKNIRQIIFATVKPDA